LFLARREFAGQALLVALLTFPLAFPAWWWVMVIMLRGAKGYRRHFNAPHGRPLGVRLFAQRLVPCYLYSSIPRVIVTVMAAATKLDASLEEAARSLGASPWRISSMSSCQPWMPALIRSRRSVFSPPQWALSARVHAGHRLEDCR